MGIEMDSTTAKVFGGKKFLFVGWAKKKLDAQRKAKQARTQGYLVRVVRDTSTGWWVIYGRRK